MSRRSFFSVSAQLLSALWAAPAWAQAAPKVRQVELQRSPVAGFQYHQGMALWPQLRVGDRLTLAREAANAFDRRAVRVDWQGHKLGYVPRSDNAAVSHLLDRGQRLEAHIVALRDEADPWRRIEFAVVLLHG